MKFILFFVLSLLLLIACDSSKNSAPECYISEDCKSGEICVDSSCVPKDTMRNDSDKRERDIETEDREGEPTDSSDVKNDPDSRNDSNDYDATTDGESDSSDKDTAPGAICGNFALETDEQCDDGNKNSGDGCNSDCEIESGFECPTPGEKCVDLDDCDPNPCGSGLCSDSGANSYTCNCDSGYEFVNGVSCTDIDDCASNPCGEGVCSDEGANSYSCVCNSGYEFVNGTNCTDIDDCVSNPCGDGVCSDDGANSYSCVCSSGYEFVNGISCTDIDDCSSNPCGDGVCSDGGANSYSCVCNSGYEFVNGTSCTDIDDCSSNPCGEGVCSDDGINSYSCVCNSGYEFVNGTDCTDIDDCAPNPCGEGVCSDEGANSYSCVCNSGYEFVNGTNCTDINDCNPNPCGSGTCSDEGVNSYGCTCESGYEFVNGTHCTDIDDCNPNPCGHGNCADQGANSYICSCESGYEFVNGTDCTDINECLNGTDGCHLNANCLNSDGGHDCNCKEGYHGDGTTACDEECGDNVQTPSEQCEDGNTETEDCPYETSCSVCGPICTDVPGNTSYCGDGVYNALFEECDNAPLNSDALADRCRTDCKNFYCGDGVKDSGEVCDDGNNLDGDYCSSDCQVQSGSCGDGVKQDGEECDDIAGNSNTISDRCRTDCTNPKCGDSVQDSGEACDDGNQIDNDYCSNSCQSTGANCGDGTVSTGEECDQEGVLKACSTISYLPTDALGDAVCNSCKWNLTGCTFSWRDKFVALRHKTYQDGNTSNVSYSDKDPELADRTAYGSGEIGNVTPVTEDGWYFDLPPYTIIVGSPVFFGGKIFFVTYTKPDAIASEADKCDLERGLGESILWEVSAFSGYPLEDRWEAGSGSTDDRIKVFLGVGIASEPTIVGSKSLGYKLVIGTAGYDSDVPGAKIFPLDN